MRTGSATSVEVLQTAPDDFAKRMLIVGFVAVPSTEDRRSYEQRRAFAEPSPRSSPSDCILYEALPYSR